MRGAASQGHVAAEGSPGALALVHRRAVVEVVHDRQPVSQLLRTAHMVRVEVRDDEVVDSSETRVLSGRDDAIGVTPVESWPAGVDQHRLAGWRDEERRLATLDVDDVDVERVRGLAAQGGGRQDGDAHEYGRGDTHGALPGSARTGRAAVLRGPVDDTGGPWRATSVRYGLLVPDRVRLRARLDRPETVAGEEIHDTVTHDRGAVDRGAHVDLAQ